MDPFRIILGKPMAIDGALQVQLKIFKTIFSDKLAVIKPKRKNSKKNTSRLTNANNDFYIY